VEVGDEMIYCKVGNCPVDNKKPICCLYCSKREGCPNACIKRNASCNLAVEVKEIKKEFPKEP
jgi:hypothetical protein